MILFALVSFTALSQIPAAIASPSQQKIQVLHADEGRIFVYVQQEGRWQIIPLLS
jgi:hypothetical protein